MQAHTPFTLLYTVFVLSVLAVATPWGVTTTSANTVTVTETVTATAPPATVTASNCDTGSISCCNTVAQAGSSQANSLLGPLAILLGPLTGLLGFDCSPISVVGIGSGNACSASPVCCENNSVGGLVNIGCIPITL